MSKEKSDSAELLAIALLGIAAAGISFGLSKLRQYQDPPPDPMPAWPMRNEMEIEKRIHAVIKRAEHGLRPVIRRG